MSEHALVEAAVLASLGDDTPEGRSILAFARDRYGIAAERPADATVIPFSANTRLSGLDHAGQSWRKGAVDSVFGTIGRSDVPPAFNQAVDRNRAHRRHAAGGRRRR